MSAIDSYENGGSFGQSPAQGAPVENPRAELQRVEADIKQCMIDISQFGEVEKLAAMTRSKASAEKKGRTVTDESAERVTKLVASLKRVEQEEVALRTENERLHAKIEDAAVAIEKKNETLAMLRDVTTNSVTGDIFALENEATRVKKHLTNLKEQQTKLKEQLVSKNKKLEGMIKLLQTYTELEEQHLEASTSLKVKKAELVDAREDEESLKRLETRKLQLLGAVSKDDVRNQVRVLEGEKRSLHSRIQNRQKQKEINQRAITTHGYEIAQLERQLQCFGDVLKEAGVQCKPDRPGVEDTEAPINVSLLEEALDIVNERRKTLEVKEKMLENRDAQIEGLEQRITILSKASHTSANLSDLMMKAQSEEYAHMQNLMEQRQQMFEEASEKLKEQQEYLRRKLEKAMANKK